MARPIPTLQLSSGQHTVLTSFVNSGKTPQSLHQRSRIILMAAQGDGNRAISVALQLNENTVGRWRQRWLDNASALSRFEKQTGLLSASIRELLADQPRAGTPAHFSAEQVCRIIALACEKPPAHLSHWSQAELARAAVERGIVESISKSSIERFLKSGRSETSPDSVLAQP